MAKALSVPGVAEPAGRQQLDVNPPENVVYEPVGLQTRQAGPETWIVQCLISPFKMITIQLNAEAKALLLEQLTGGIVIPS